MREDIKTVTFPDGGLLSVAVLKQKNNPVAEVRTLDGLIKLPLERLTELAEMLHELSKTSLIAH